MALYDYGSGTLGDYRPLGHTVNGNFATADVGIVGDSITYRGWSELSAALAVTGKTLAVDAWSGRPTTPAVTSTLARPTLPRILVMATGTNDIFQPMVMAAQIARMVNLPGVEHLIWVDTYCVRTSVKDPIKLNDMRNTGLVNNQIHDVFKGDHMVDWNRWLGYRGMAYIPTYLQDGVHPKISSGTKFWAEVLMRKIRLFL